MSYQKRARRLTIPLETNEQIKNARDIFLELHESFKKIARSPNAERNKVYIAQMEIMYKNTEFKSRANGEPLSSYYKSAT
tara:strand:+ start:569 stop:808 length:240 start_codon:yes stop_codon:yes gene_type:complete